ncbi:isoprenoid biosynthesis glyoxalase ElbB [Proteus myxofaciens]|uniref:Glyoxalase n=1 Tax=Proteus myxofaciens ATCC 19692 TaxID=1354337 RepID=A0A198FMY9_9GAMM|nr:isoprenoid biosynthesis glyoxalase ElbB [Proteus myxofaciens]OAT26140.1 sigma cross-reacting protein 27A [Proteus myxofaciens ATCC 19692]
MKSIAIILSGCGVFDGSEIHESVLTMLALSQNNAEVHYFSPDDLQPSVINHITGEEKSEKRNMMEESSRISRGKISPLSDAKAEMFDAVIIPGGFGAAKNLCTFATEGVNCEINKELLNFVQEMNKQKKPLGLMCIAPVMLPKMLNSSVKLTIGNDPQTAKMIEEMGGIHINCAVDDIVVDEEQRVVTTPAYMLAESIAQAQVGINKLVKKVLEMA